MARKTSTVPTRIWSFGARPPRSQEDRESVREQLWKANRYYNRLIEIEIARRKAFRETRARLIPQLAELEEKNEVIQAALDAARQDLRNLRKSARQRSDAPGLKTRIVQLVKEAREIGKSLKAERKAVTDATKLVRERLMEMATLAETEQGRGSERMKTLQLNLQALPKNVLDFVEAADRVQATSYQAIRDARATCDVYWGTYLLVEEAAKTASKSLTDPRFKRFTGEGRLGVQIQGGMTTQALFSGRSTLLQLDPLSPDQWDSRGGCRHAYTIARIRVGTVEKGRAPLWMEFPTLIHRKMPDGLVKQAWIQVRRLGLKTKYQLQLMIESAEFMRRERGRGTVALDVGWRSLPNGNLRVAYWVDSSGRHGSLELPERLRSGLSLPEALRGFNDKHFEAAKKALREWMARQPPDRLPAWLVEDTSHIAQWRQPRRLAHVAHKLTSELAPDAGDLWCHWKRERLSANPRRDLFATLNEIGAWLTARGVADESVRVAVYLHFWRLKNCHLLNWESNQRDKVLGHRKDIYNQWSNWLVRTYDTIVLEEFDLRTVAKRAQPEEDDDAHQAVRHNRTVAAVSELRLAIKERAAPEALILCPVSPSTITCHACRHEENFDRAAELVHTCPGCGRSWDQDWNHAANLLLDVMTNDPNAPPGERSGGVESAESARKGRNVSKSRKNSKALPQDDHRD